jgi:hypothetical protein
MNIRREFLVPAAAAVVLLTSCSDSTAPPIGEALSVCHVSGTTGSIIEIRSSDLQDHWAHGDYVTRFIVKKGSALNGDGIHFARITDAIAVARLSRIRRGETTSALCRVTIAVSPGVYSGSVNDTLTSSLEELPLTIDVPDITLLGSFVMSLDAKGRAAGGAVGNEGSSTTLVANPGLVSIKTGNVLDKYAEPLIVVNGHPDGPRGNGAVIEGFVLQSGNSGENAVVGGNAVWAMRVSGVVVKGNLIDAGFAEPIEMRASAGRVEGNLLTGKGGSCAICMFGPGDYHVIANRQIGVTGRLAVLVFPTISAAVPPNVEPFTLPSTALVTAEVANNEFRNHQEVPFGIGVRVAAIGPGAPNVEGMARVTVRDNDLSDNRFGVVAEAGFLVANTAQRGSIELTLNGNAIAGSCQVGLLVALNSQATAIASGSGLSTRNSTYTIHLGDNIAWSDAWYSHPAGTGSSLTVDGEIVENGSRVSYDAKGC